MLKITLSVFKANLQKYNYNDLKTADKLRVDMGTNTSTLTRKLEFQL